MNKLSNIALLEKYFNYELNDKEDELFKTKLTNDEEFKEEYEIALLLRAKALKKPKANYPENASNNINTKTISLKKFLPLLSAAAVLLFIGVALFNKANSFDTEYYIAERLDVKNAVPIGFEKSNNIDEILIKDAKKAYKEKNYKSAIANFKKQDQQLNLDLESRFYLGLSFFYEKQYNQAATEFRKIDSPTSDFFKDAQFYTALCHLKLQENQKAKQILATFKKDKSFGKEDDRKFIKAMLKKL